MIGYIGRINQAEKRAIGRLATTPANYRGTDYIGKLGVEQSYESELHGTTGVEEVEIDAGGRAVRTPVAHAADAGQQRWCCRSTSSCRRWSRQLFGDRRGALVAIDPRTGEVLAFVSASPDFDPNLFVDGIDAAELAARSTNRPTSRCSTARCAAPIRRARPSSRSWRWPR